MFKINIWVTSGMVHKAHIKCTISVHMLNFQQKHLYDWFQMSQLGTFFLKIIFFGLATCWLCSTGRFLWGGILAPLDREAGVREDNLRRACTWFFRAKARLEPDKSWKDVLDSWKTRQEECLALLLSLDFSGHKGLDTIWASLLTSH